MTEQAAGLRLDSSDDDEEGAAGESERRTNRSRVRKAARSGNDYLSNIIHRQKKTTSRSRPSRR